jgi:hypothetical protein
MNSLMTFHSLNTSTCVPSTRFKKQNAASVSELALILSHITVPKGNHNFDLYCHKLVLYISKHCITNIDTFET